MRKRVPTNFDTTAVTIKFPIAALKTPSITGILVFSETSDIIFSISSLLKRENLCLKVVG